MNAHGNLNFEDMLRMQLVTLQQEHLAADVTLQELAAAPHPDQLLLRRIKKQKLSIKDQIARINAKLLPDIIA